MHVVGFDQTPDFSQWIGTPPWESDFQTETHGEGGRNGGPLSFLVAVVKPRGGRTAGTGVAHMEFAEGSRMGLNRGEERGVAWIAEGWQAMLAPWVWHDM